jgi:hypothetical protein
MVRLEAERSGVRQARTVLVIADGGNWIDPLQQKHFPSAIRILDYIHACEHLSDVAKARYGSDEKQRKRWYERRKQQLWAGKRRELLQALARVVEHLGQPQASDPEDHPRRVALRNLRYFREHKQQINYPQYRANSWPISSALTKSGVKRFNKRQAWPPVRRSSRGPGRALGRVGR